MEEKVSRFHPGVDLKDYPAECQAKDEAKKYWVKRRPYFMVLFVLIGFTLYLCFGSSISNGTDMVTGDVSLRKMITLAASIVLTVVLTSVVAAIMVRRSRARQ